MRKKDNVEKQQVPPTMVQPPHMAEQAPPPMQQTAPNTAPPLPQAGSKTIYCKKCGQVIYKKVKRCPYCGQKNKRPPIAGLVVLAIIIVIIVAAANSAANAPPAEEREALTPEGLQSALNSEFQSYDVDFWILNIDPDANILSIAARTEDPDFDISLARDLNFDAIEFVIKYFRDGGRNVRNNTTISCELLVGEQDAYINEMWLVAVSVYVPEDNTVVFTEVNTVRDDFWANYSG